MAEHEIAERARRRIERHLAKAKLLPGKTLESFDFNAVPMLSKAQISALCAGDAWLRNGSNLILVGPPGTGKSHLSSAIGLSLIEQGWKVLFARTSDLVQRLQVARRELALEAAIHRLDRFDLVILDDFAYVTKDQAETSVLFELISARYARRSLLITANQPFGDWNKVFPDPAMTLAAVDRLVHHATILERRELSPAQCPAEQTQGPRTACTLRHAEKRGRPPRGGRSMRTGDSQLSSSSSSDTSVSFTEGAHPRSAAAQRQRAYRLRRKRAVIEAIGEEISAPRVVLLNLLSQDPAVLDDDRASADRHETRRCSVKRILHAIVTRYAIDLNE